MTVQEVKDKLPNVKVKLFGRVLTGHVSGRKKKYATVWVKSGGHIYDHQYSWQTVARAITMKQPLRVS